MAELLIRIILPMGLAGGAFYLVLLALRPLWGRLAPRLRKAGLLAVCALMLVPLPFAVSALVAQADAPSRAQTVQYNPAYRVGENLGEAIRYEAVAEPVPQSEPDGAAPAPAPVDSAYTGSPEPTWPSTAQLLAFIYLTGLAAAVFLYTLRYTRLMRALAKDRAPADDEAQAACLALCKELGIKRPPLLYRSARVPAPFLAGVLRPAIYLPEDLTDPQFLNFTLRHELAHYKKGDLSLKLVVLAASAVQWYIPLWPLLQRDFAEVCEEDCDAFVAATLSGAQRQAYAGLLLDYAGSRLPGAALAFSSPKGRLKKRLGLLLRPAKPRRALKIAGAITLCALVAGGLLVGCSMAVGMEGAEEANGPTDLPMTDFEKRLVYGEDSGNSAENPPANFRANYEQLLEAYGTGKQLTAFRGAFNEVGEKSTRPRRQVVWSFYATQLDNGTEFTSSIPCLRNDIPVYATLHDGDTAVVNPVPDADPGHWPDKHPKVYAPHESRWTANFFAPVGSPVVAVADGVVVDIGYEDYLGHFLLLAHSPDETSMYTGFAEVSAIVGSEVRQGDALGTVGMPTGALPPHINYMLRGGYYLFDPAITPDEVTELARNDPRETSTSTWVGEWELSLAYPVEVIKLGFSCEDDSLLMDVYAEPGSEVLAAAYGRVVEVGANAEWDNYVVITLPNQRSVRYTHCGTLRVAEGNEVFRNQPIATVGAIHGGQPGIHVEMIDPTGYEIDTCQYFSRDSQLPPLLADPLPGPGEVVNPYVEGQHPGMDISVPAGTYAVAVHYGEVIRSGYDEILGNYVRILHKDLGLATIYAHCDTLYVVEGEMVTVGQAVASVGANPHVGGEPALHFEVWDAAVQPVDPQDWVDFD